MHINVIAVKLCIGLQLINFSWRNPWNSYLWFKWGQFQSLRLTLGWIERYRRVLFITFKWRHLQNYYLVGWWQTPHLVEVHSRSAQRPQGVHLIIKLWMVGWLVVGNCHLTNLWRAPPGRLASSVWAWWPFSFIVPPLWFASLFAVLC